MTTNANPDIVNKAKAYARKAIHEAWPTVNEVNELTIGMYEFDVICIDDEACPVSSVSIMHDPDADTFALVENARPTTPPKNEAVEQAPAFHFDKPIDWDKLAEDHAIAYLRGDLATSSPESYSIEEMRVISEGMDASTAEVEAAMRKDFQELPPHAQVKMLDLLQKVDLDHFQWWKATLLDDMSNSPEQLNAACE